MRIPMFCNDSDSSEAHAGRDARIFDWAVKLKLLKISSMLPTPQHLNTPGIHMSRLLRGQEYRQRLVAFGAYYWTIFKALCKSYVRNGTQWTGRPANKSMAIPGKTFRISTRAHLIVGYVSTCMIVTKSVSHRSVRSLTNGNLFESNLLFLNRLEAQMDNHEFS